MFEHVKKIAAKSVEAIMIIWIVLSFSLLTIWVMREYQELQSQKVVDSGYPQRSEEDLKKRMRYHGTLIAYQRESDRRWVFDRDGQQCKLFK